MAYLWIDSGHLCQSSTWPSFASLFTSLSLTRRLGRVLRAPCCPVLSTKHPIFSNCRSHVECGRGSDIENTYVIIESAQIMNNCCPYCKNLKIVTFQQLVIPGGRGGGRIHSRETGHYTFLGNCPPTPPLSQQFAFREK